MNRIAFHPTVRVLHDLESNSILDPIAVHGLRLKSNSDRINVVDLFAFDKLYLVTSIRKDLVLVSVLILSAPRLNDAGRVVDVNTAPVVVAVIEVHIAEALLFLFEFLVGFFVDLGFVFCRGGVDRHRSY